LELRTGCLIFLHHALEPALKKFMDHFQHLILLRDCCSVEHCRDGFAAFLLDLMVLVVVVFVFGTVVWTESLCQDLSGSYIRCWVSHDLSTIYIFHCAHHLLYIVGIVIINQLIPPLHWFNITTDCSLY
jgi:hypothetical protein